MGELVVVCVDGSENTQSAFDYYIKKFHKPENIVTILHVLEQIHMPIHDLSSGGSGFDPEKLIARTQELVKKSEQLVEHYKILCEQKQVKCKVVVEPGSSGGPGHGIVKQSTELKADLIVLGSRGESAIRRTMTGSVSDYVIHKSRVPTLIVPPTE